MRAKAGFLAPILILAGMLANAGPVAAAMPDGAYARLSTSIDGDGGLIFLSYTGSTTVNAGVLGLIGSAEYYLFGSSQGCGKMPSSANQVFRVKGMTDEDGVLWMRRSPEIGARVNSFWLGSNDHLGAAVCSISFNFDKMDLNVVGDWNGDGILGIWDKEHVLSLLERKPNNRARLSIVVEGGAGDDTVTVRGVNRRCGTKPTQTQFFVNFDRPVDYMSRMISITPSEMGMIRSERVVFDAAHHGCANIIGILIA